MAKSMVDPGLGTLDYFKREFVAFYEALGQAAFWALLPEQRQAAITGLLHAAKEVRDDPANEAFYMIGLAVDEYTRRYGLIGECSTEGGN